MSTSTTLLTFEEFEKLPDAPGKRELLDGELIEMPPPKKKHSRVQQRVRRRLEPHVLAQNLGEVYTEAGFKLGGRHWFQPDVSLITAEQETRGDDEGYFEGAPRLAIEVISPSNTAKYVERKIAKYLEYGAEEVWVFYPKTKRVWVYRRNEPAIEYKDQLTSPLFPDWSLNLSEIFR